MSHHRCGLGNSSHHWGCGLVQPLAAPGARFVGLPIPSAALRRHWRTAVLRPRFVQCVGAAHGETAGWLMQALACIEVLAEGWLLGPSAVGESDVASQ